MDPSVPPKKIQIATQIVPEFTYIQSSGSGWIHRDYFFKSIFLGPKPSIFGEFLGSKTYSFWMFLGSITLSCLPSLKLTARPWKWMVGRQAFPIGMSHFQGQTVSFREGNRLKQPPGWTWSLSSPNWSKPHPWRPKRPSNALLPWDRWGWV